MLCRECGRGIGEQRICPYCHTQQGLREHKTVVREKKEVCRYRTVAGFLQIFLGVFGAGRLYLGYTKTALLQMLASVLSCGVLGFFWGFVDGVMILNGCEKYDADGKPLL